MREHFFLGFKFLIPFCAVVLFASFCPGQNDALHQDTAANQWKTTQLEELDQRLDSGTAKNTQRRELESRKAWLTKWTPGKMDADARENSSLPKVRTEPILNSIPATELQKELMAVQGSGEENTVIRIFEKAIANHPNDIGTQQLHLSWIDHPLRRKSFLNEIEVSTNRLLKLLETQDRLAPEIQLARQFTLYRRGRALAYRELPDVVKHTPITDPKRLDDAIRSAYEELISSSGSGRPEFVLLEIRVLRRDEKFGTALCMLEKFGSVIKPKWYLKKRRDLLKELQWEFPHDEAAAIYASKFPEEVAKEALE